MKSLYLFIFALFISSCIQEENNRRRFRDKRGKIKPIERVFKEQGPEETKESLIFPISLTAENKISLASIDKRHKKFSISSTDQNEAIQLIAGLSGLVEIKTENGVHILSIQATKNTKTLYFELNETTTKLKVESKTQVTQTDLLAETKKPIIFYIKEGELFKTLCFPIEDVLKKANLTRNFSDHPACLL